MRFVKLLVLSGAFFLVLNACGKNGHYPDENYISGQAIQSVFSSEPTEPLTCEQLQLIFSKVYATQDCDSLRILYEKHKKETWVPFNEHK